MRARARASAPGMPPKVAKKGKGGGGGGGAPDPAAEVLSKVPISLRSAYERLCASFAQSLLGRGLISRRGAFLQLQRLVAAPGLPSKLNEHVTLKGVMLVANSKLLPLGFTLRRCRDENSGNLYLAFVNRIDDDLAKAAVKSAGARDEWQCALFQHLFRAVTEGAGGGEHAGSVARAQLCADFGAEARVKLAKPPSHADIDAALDRFLREGWLVEAAGAPRRLILGPRAFAELHDTIHLAVDERCPICTEVVVFGELVTVDDRAWWQRARAAALRSKFLSHARARAHCHRLCPPPLLPSPRSRWRRARHAAAAHRLRRDGEDRQGDGQDGAPVQGRDGDGL